MGRAGTGASPGRRPRIRIVMPPSSTKICGAPRATVSRAIVAPNISTYHCAAACESSLMMCTWSNRKAGLLIRYSSFFGGCGGAVAAGRPILRFLGHNRKFAAFLCQGFEVHETPHRYIYRHADGGRHPRLPMIERLTGGSRPPPGR